MNRFIVRLLLPIIMLCLTFGCQKEVSNTNENTQLAITSFSPENGKAGTEVTIRGRGFATTPTDNRVTINTGEVEVIRATDSVLVIRIQQGTSSGKITVRVNDQTTTSANDFLVLGQTVKIISFTPELGTAGTAVTIKGEGFSHTPSDNIVKINGTDAEVLAATDTTLFIKVLPGTSSGKISVTNNGQTATSSNDFTIITANELWTKKADVPAQWSSEMEISIVHGFAINDKGYFYKAGELWQYDPASNTWFRKSDLPSNYKNNYNFCFTANGKAYVGLGAGFLGEEINRTEHREVWEYNPLTDGWLRKKDFPGPPRVLSFSFSINNMGYVGGGDTANMSEGVYNDFWQYDPLQDQWNKKSNFPGTKLTSISGYAIGDKGFLLESGTESSGGLFDGTETATLWQYDVAKDQWTKKTGLSVAGRNIVWTTCFSINGKGYAAIGTDATDIDTNKQDFWQYDPATDKWINKPDIGGDYRVFASSFAIGNKGYVGLGTGSMVDDVLYDFWEYTP